MEMSQSNYLSKVFESEGKEIIGIVLQFQVAGDKYMQGNIAKKLVQTIVNYSIYASNYFINTFI